MRYLSLILILFIFACEKYDSSEKESLVKPTMSYEEALKGEAFTTMASKIGAKLTEADRAIMKESNAKLASEIVEPGLSIGERAPDFSLQNAFGKKTSLSSALTNGPVILVFYRGAWCPFCNVHLRVLQENMAEFQKYNAQLLTITPQQPDKSAEQLKNGDYDFEVLSDLDYQVMKDYNLYFEVPNEIVEIYQRVGIDLDEYNGQDRAGLPVPGTFIIDQQGIIRAVHAETDYSKRMEPADILVELAKL